MRTYLITGGTDGIGRGLGLHFLTRGDRVIAVSSSDAKGQAFLQQAGHLGATDRAEFLRADLSTVTGMRAVVAAAEQTVDRLDGLVFATQRFQARRVLTTDGLEYTFALSYLSRFILGHELSRLLERTEAPVIFNLAGPGGLPGKIFWDDPSFERETYSGQKAAMQASRANDLMGVDYTRRHTSTKIRYMLYNPLFVKTAMADPLPQPMKAITKALAAVLAQKVEQAVQPMAALMDDPPREPVSAFRRRKQLPLTGKAFDLDLADRLYRLTEQILTDVRH